jgi:putative nucleotidyltransferase with HDIG domain
MEEKRREDGWQLLTEFVQAESLRRHCLAVETAMRAYARELDESQEDWGLLGLVHDFDYEIHPTADLHPEAGVPILRERGYPEWLIRAVRSHAEYLDVPRVTPMERTLFAVDELTGFISAVALVRPSKRVSDVTAASVRKKMKDKAFARPVHRETLISSADELGVDFDQHVTFVIGALAANAAVLGLEGMTDAAR